MDNDGRRQPPTPAQRRGRTAVESDSREIPRDGSRRISSSHVANALQKTQGEDAGLGYRRCMYSTSPLSSPCHSQNFETKLRGLTC